MVTPEATHTGPDEAEKQNTDTAFVVPNSETASNHSETRTTQDVRQGHTGDHVRQILIYSSVAAFVCLIGAYLIFAA
ncbi:hypothetical protein [Parvularcula sp. LCG005]|uniref:hypothetical protein n=1 Tax=Parvularcula sp. LCG005 TaxID=3078805 RepID=UPI0029437673|nr:hypothetical protein [Parvularcula sp. LCG005]WOI54060.1 hypothetical protein RUI03_03420 [Parvularcula sp. LCG005]